MSQKRTYEIDGRDFSNLKEFAGVLSQVALVGYVWNGRDDALNDILRGGLSMPEEGFILRWKNSALSRKRLGPEVFDHLVEIVQTHCPGGAEEEDCIELMLE